MKSMDDIEPYSDWDDVIVALETLVASHPEIDADTLRNAKDLVTQCLRGLRVPDEVAKGYWPTISIIWLGLAKTGMEIEIFQNRIEIYRFRKDGGTDIEEFNHESGNPIGVAVTDRLTSMVAEFQLVSTESVIG